MSCLLDYSVYFWWSCIHWKWIQGRKRERKGKDEKDKQGLFIQKKKKQGLSDCQGRVRKGRLQGIE